MAPENSFYPFGVLREQIDAAAQANRLFTIPFRFVATGIPYAQEVDGLNLKESIAIVAVRYAFGWEVEGGSFLFGLNVALNPNGFTSIQAAQSPNSTIVDDIGTVRVAGYIPLPAGKVIYGNRSDRISVIPSVSVAGDNTTAFATAQIPGFCTIYYFPTYRQVHHGN